MRAAAWPSSRSGTALLSLLVLARLYGLVGLLARDVAKRRALEDQLSYQAFHDPLTGLANRRRFVEQAEAALAGRRRTGTIAAMFLDLDDFKTVNDSLGHAAGDEMLRVVAARIARRTPDHRPRRATRRRRIRGPALRRPGRRRRDGAAQRLLDALQAPVTIGDSVVEVGASIGIAIDSPEMGRVDDLLGDADVAMYQAKALGKGRFHVFTGDPEGAAVRPRTWSEQPRHVRRQPIGRPSSNLAPARFRGGG